jgi:Protein of unknown function (DUF3500)
MKLSRMLMAVTVLGIVAGVAYVGQRGESPGVNMVAAADRLMGSLTAEQKAKAAFDYDSPERTRWFFTPQQDAQRRATRKGLPLADMNPEQKKLARDLVAAGTSERGNIHATTIMSLESILHQLEKKGRMVRDPEWYFFTVFGTPSKTGKWGWRVEGHHLSLNFTMEGSQVVASTPTFFGANPADVKSGPKKGLRILARAEDLAIKLLNALDEDQKKIAYQPKVLPEIKENTPRPNPGPPHGLPAAKMTDSQREILLELLHTYTNRMPPEIGQAELKHVKEAGIDKVYFSYQGGTEPGKKHSYRLQGPTFIVEFLNEQADSAGNPANHIHSVWRRLKGDFGLN